jgi:hypothetical protein
VISPQDRLALWKLNVKNTRLRIQTENSHLVNNLSKLSQNMPTCPHFQTERKTQRNIPTNNSIPFITPSIEMG